MLFEDKRLPSLDEQYKCRVFKPLLPFNSSLSKVLFSGRFERVLLHTTRIFATIDIICSWSSNKLRFFCFLSACFFPIADSHFPRVHFRPLTLNTWVLPFFPPEFSTELLLTRNKGSLRKWPLCVKASYHTVTEIIFLFIWSLFKVKLLY